MHSMHQVRTLNSVAPPHVQQHVMQQELNSTGQQQDQQLGMTVLESLEPAQTGSQQQAVIHHLAPAPLLHQLQPSNRQLIEQQHELEQQLEQQQQQQQQQELNQRDDLQLQQATNSNQTTSRQQQHRANAGQQLEGIVADGGGPIVQWLLENYEIAEGESLPRSTVYNHYLAHCRSLRMSSVNAASFGKLIRSVFIGLKTRRLGTRGHSKYHYFGVRAKQHVRFDWLHETGVGSAISEGGRTGAAAAAMLRDTNLTNCDTNSNCGSDGGGGGGGGQCGSETDSTGNCSGRLSTSISAVGHLNQSGNQINGTPNGTNNSTATTNPATATTTTTTLNNVHANKRLKRMQVVATTPDDHYHHLQQQQAHQEHNLEANLDQQHLHHQMHYTHQSDHSANGIQYQDGMVQSNGYDKQDLFAGSVAVGSDEQSDFSQWSNAHFSQYDLASLRIHLNLEKATSLVHDHWPEREPDQLERLIGRKRMGPAGGEETKQERESNSAGDSQDHCQLSRLIEPFESQYKFHYKRLVELLSELNFVEIDRLWAHFWRPQTAAHWQTNSATNELNDNSTRRRPTNSNYDQQQDSAPSGQLTFGQLYELTSRPEIIERIAQIDRRLFAAIEKFLVVDMLNPLPRVLIQSLRSFARQVCGWQEAAVKDYSPEFVAQKIRSTRSFELALRRSTSINHLSSAARAIWSKRSVLSQMSVDLSRLDLSDLEHQVASLMNQEKFPTTTLAEVVVEQTQTRDSQLVDRRDLLQTVPATKPIDNQQQQQHYEQGAEKTVSSGGNAANIQEANDNIENTYTSQQHLNSISSQQQSQPNHLGHNSFNCSHGPNNTNQTNTNDHFLIHSNQTSPLQPGQLVQNFLHLLEDPFPAGQWPHWCRSLVESRVSGRSLDEARDFILKWNFYISLILRELTLKSAPSLGSFQLIRLLFDEFMYHLVVSKLQQVASQSEPEETKSAKFQQNNQLDI